MVFLRGQSLDSSSHLEEGDKDIQIEVGQKRTSVMTLNPALNFKTMTIKLRNKEVRRAGKMTQCVKALATIKFVKCGNKSSIPRTILVNH